MSQKVKSIFSRPY